MAQARVPFQGLPARICWLGYGERARAGLAFNELVRTGRGQRRRSSSVATTSTRDRSRRPTARPRRWPTAPTRSPTGRCSTRWSTRPPGRPGCRSTTAAASGSATRQHAGMVVVADGTPLAAQKLERVLTTDPAMGVLRHVDAGYERAIEVARERGVRVPMLARTRLDREVHAGVHPLPTRTAEGAVRCSWVGSGVAPPGYSDCDTEAALASRRRTVRRVRHSSAPSHAP